MCEFTQQIQDVGFGLADMNATASMFSVLCKPFCDAILRGVGNYLFLTLDITLICSCLVLCLCPNIKTSVFIFPLAINVNMVEKHVSLNCNKVVLSFVL